MHDVFFVFLKLYNTVASAGRYLFNCDENVYFKARLDQLLSFKTMFLLKRTS